MIYNLVLIEMDCSVREILAFDSKEKVKDYIIKKYLNISSEDLNRLLRFDGIEVCDAIMQIHSAKLNPTTT